MPGTDGGYHPFFSPDGEWVVFYSDETDQKLKRVSIRGGPPQVLADAQSASGGIWATNDTIVFATQYAGQARSLFSIPATGGTPELLITPEPNTGHVWPEVLPGGEAILFVIRPGAGGLGNARNGRIAVLSLETGEYQALVEGGYRPQYAPTGHIVFVRAGALWAVPFDVETLAKIGPEVPVIEGVQQNGFIGGAAYAFSDNGMLVYAPGGDTTAAESSALVWVDREGREELVAEETRTLVQLRLSPDGGRLAAATSVISDNQDIWIYDLARGTSARLTFDSASDQAPLWTPDGKRVVFSSSREGGGLFWKAADGTGQVERLTTSASPQIPEAFSPDGMQLVFREGSPQWDLYVLSMEGEPTSKPLFQTAFNEVASAISPDGRWIAYASNETGRDQVYVRPFPNVDDGKWQISTDGGQEPLLWGPEGRELFYGHLSGGRIMVVAVEADPAFSAENPRVLLTVDYVDRATAFPSFDISPDGQRFLVIKGSGPTEEVSGPTELIVVENWFEELNRLAPPSP